MLHRTCLAGVVLLAMMMGACDTSSPSGPSPLQTILGGSPPAPPTPSPPTPGNGINGRYRGDFTFTEMDRTSCGQHCWPTHFTVVANLRQNGDDVTGDFDVREVIYSGGDVEGTVDTTTGVDMLGTSERAFYQTIWAC
jgi:hypothetical protein